jgi:preprotein translocase subunit SecG
MTIFPILAVSFIMDVVAVLFVLCCVTLILIILIQKGRGGGLSAAFGGAMASGILGSKTGDFLTWVTIVLVGVFLTLAVVMGKFYKPSAASDYDVSPQTQQQPLQSPGQPESPDTTTEEPAGQTGERSDMNLPDS